jgi:hypothetical protein
MAKDEYPDLDKISKIIDNPAFQQRQVEHREIPILNSKEEWIEWLNKSYACITINGKFKILHEKPNGEIEFMDKKDFISSLENRRVMVTSPEDGKSKYLPVTEMWLKGARREYMGIIFDPSRIGHYNGLYNLWKGYKILGVSGDCSIFLDYVKEIMCNNNERDFNYLVALIAQMFQQPWAKPGIAVVIRGDEGVGKSFFIEKLGTLMDGYYFKTSNPQYIFGDHNGQLKNVVLLHLEEAVWAGSKKDESLLKDLITGRTIQINDKFMPVISVPNHLHLFITGNPEWLVSAGFKARRLFALHAITSHIRDTKYFAELDQWFNNGGSGALIDYFINYKGDIDLRIVPNTDELMEQKQQSMYGVIEWIYSIVDSKEMPYGDYNKSDDHIRVIKKLMLLDYNHSPSGRRHQLSDRKFGIQFTDILTDVLTDNIKIKDSREVRRDGYEIPDNKSCRKMIETMLGGKCKWTTPDGHWTVLKGNTDFDFSLYKPDK